MQLMIPLKQHVGVPAKPIVSVGDVVKRGELIALPQGLGANIHASHAGTIREISAEFIKLLADENQPDEFVKLQKTDHKLELIKEAGIVGAGGAGFPTHVKLDVDLTGGYVVANGAECEPLLAHNLYLMENQPQVIIRGLKHIKEITQASKGLIALKSKYKKAVALFEKLCSAEPDIEVKILPDIYPVGDERVIVREILGQELAPGQLPTEVGVVVQNVETLKHIVNAIEERRPCITKDITVAGRVKGSKTGKVYLDVALGESVGKYIQLAGGYLKPYGEIVIGGPFTGQRGSENSPITKTSGGILVAMPFPQEQRKIGLLACECGAGEERLREIANSMGAEVVAVEKCKRMVEVNGRYRCDQPGTCPGQAEKILALKNQGMQALLVGSCGD